MPVPPFAHLGHWYVSLPIFMGPVVLIAVALKIQTWRERRKGPDTSGKRSTLTATTGDHTTTIEIAGPLDYPALVELESALGGVQEDAQVTLDLRRLTNADQEAAWSLCDAIGRARAAGRIDVLLAGGLPHVETLADTLASEGISISRTPSPPPPSAPVVRAEPPPTGRP